MKGEHTPFAILIYGHSAKKGVPLCVIVRYSTEHVHRSFILRRSVHLGEVTGTAAKYSSAC
jgi:hypothetical protein